MARKKSYGCAINGGSTKGTFIVFLMIFLTTTAYADTLLMGFESTQMRPPPNQSQPCFQPARNIVNNVWKVWRWPASASGTISYFKMRIPQLPIYNGDEFCWAIYEDNNGSVGALKAYGYYSSYNWIVGYHTFNVTNTVTNLNIVSGTYYWLVAYSNMMDTENTADPIYTERGDGDCAPGIRILSPNQHAWESVSTPPPPNYYINAMNSYHAWSVWQRSGPPDETPPAAPTGLTIVQ